MVCKPRHFVADVTGPAVTVVTPQEMRLSYGINLILFGNIVGDGRCQTIAVIEALHNPTAVSDANLFSTVNGLPQFNVPGGPTLMQVNQNGGLTLPSNANSTWWTESSLDIQAIHTIAPQANIIVFEANSSNFPDLFTAAKNAGQFPGVSVVSMSFSGGETTSESGTDPWFTDPGVTYLASTGDTGIDQYPSASPNVVAVGGTVLSVDSSGNYLGEVPWGGSGGGISPDKSQPSYQSSKVSSISTTQRVMPDVSMDAGTAFPIYMNGNVVNVGGTSLSCPMWAGLIVIANQGCLWLGQGPLTGVIQTLPELYNLPYYHCPSPSGFDPKMGLGSPIANLLIPALAGYSPSSTKQAPQTTPIPPTTQAPVTTVPPGTTQPPSSGVTSLSRMSVPATGKVGVPFAPISIGVCGPNKSPIPGNSDIVIAKVFTFSGVASQFGAGSTISVPAVNGVATFTNLIPTFSGSNHIQFSDGNVTTDWYVLVN